MDLDVTELETLCRELRGQHMTHERLRGVECNGAWPVVDADGNLTGDIAETGGVLVDWEDGRLTERNGHACEAILSADNNPEPLPPEAIGLTCVHAEKGLCPSCSEDYEEDPESWIEFGLHKDGIARWAAELVQIAADAAEAAATPKAPPDPDMPF